MRQKKYKKISKIEIVSGIWSENDAIFKRVMKTEASILGGGGGGQSPPMKILGWQTYRFAPPPIISTT